MNPTDTDLSKKFAERFEQLPKVVQNAITSADVQKRLRELADQHKLHLDQWGMLENEVMLALLGFQAPEQLPISIEKEVGLSKESANELAAAISELVFKPIRQELERELDHPEAREANKTVTDHMREQILSANATQAIPPAPAQAAPTGAVATPIPPGTPPNTPTVAPVARAPLAQTYKPGEASTDRKTVHDDPYRESPV